MVVVVVEEEVVVEEGVSCLFLWMSQRTITLPGLLLQPMLMLMVQLLRMRNNLSQ